MDTCRLQWVGAPAGQHGPNTFYKGCKFFKNGKWRFLSMGEFFFLKTSESEPLCVAELQLLWQDDKAESGGLMLSSSKLYFLPEDTPEGRTVHHGENEVVGVNGKVIVRLEDLIGWICTDVRWTKGYRTICKKDIKSNDELDRGNQQVVLFAENSGLDISEVNKEKQINGYGNDEHDKVIILNYPIYCRYVTALKRIENAQTSWISNILVQTLGAFTVPHHNTRVMFCKGEFDHPTLAFNEKLCDHLAPNMKGRPRKKKLDIRSNSNEDLVGDSSNDATENAQVQHTLLSNHHLSKLGRKKLCGKYRTKIVNGKVKTEVKRVRPKDEATFLTGLFKFMKDRNSPIDRVPYLGFKQIDLYLFFTMGQQFGGYEAITAKRLWKRLYDELGGSVGSTSAATCTRRHYERLILPYERFLNKQEHKPLPCQPSRSKPGISILAKPVKVKCHPEQDGMELLKHQRKKEKHSKSKDQSKEMTKAEETWIRDKQKHVPPKPVHKTIRTLLPPFEVTTSQEQPTLTYEVVPNPSPIASVSLSAPLTVPSLSLVTRTDSSPSTSEGLVTSLKQPSTAFSQEPSPVPDQKLGMSSSPLPPLKMKLKVKKSKHKSKKRCKVLKEKLQEQRAKWQNETNSQLCAKVPQLSSPPVARKKTMSIADILDHQAKMKAKQKATTLPTLPPMSTSGLALPYHGKPFMVKTENGLPVAPLFFTIPQMMPGGVPVETSLGGEGGSMTSCLNSTSAPALTLNSNMATVVHVGQPLQVMQMPTPSSEVKESAVLESAPHVVSNASAASSVYTTNATDTCLSYPYTMGVPSNTPALLTAVVNPMAAPQPPLPLPPPQPPLPLPPPQPHSPSQTKIPTSHVETASSRPSVIQHTQHIQLDAPDQVVTSPPFKNAVLPSDMILRNLSHEKEAAAASAAAAAAAAAATAVVDPITRTPSSTPVVGQKLSDLPKGAVVVTPRMVSPYLTYIPMPVMIPDISTEQNTDQSKVEMSKEPNVKRKRTESGKENISRPLSPHGFSLDRTGKLTTLPFARPPVPAPVPIQDEPCDLSMPKRQRNDEETHGMKKDAHSHGKHRSSSHKHGESSKNRTHLHGESGVKHHREDVHKVKMTPNPRGSIMQGVINPSALSPSSFSKGEQRDTPSRHCSSSSGDAVPSHSSQPFPYLPHPSMQVASMDKQSKSQFVFPDFNSHLSAMMGYPPRLFTPPFLSGPLLTRPDLLSSSLPPAMQLSHEQLMRQDMFFPPRLPFPLRPPFHNTPPLVRESQQPYTHQS